MWKKEKGFMTEAELEKKIENDRKFFNNLVEELKRECEKHKIDAEISQDAQHIIIKTKERESHIRKWRTLPPTRVSIEDYIKDYLGIPKEDKKEE